MSRRRHTFFLLLLVAVLWMWGRRGGAHISHEVRAVPPPPFGLGTWRAKPGEVGHAVQHALAHGYTHIDMSPRYRNEVEIGEVFAGLRDASSGLQREHLYLASKLWNTDHRADRVAPALTRTLNDLQLDYLDLWYLHWPVPLVQGHDTPGDIVHDEQVQLEYTWHAMEEEYYKGRVRALGVSNFNIEQLQRLLSFAKVRPVANQVELHPYLPQGRLVQWCKERAIAVVAYCPIGSPGNAAHNREDVTPLIRHPEVVALAGSLAMTPAQVLLRWGLQKGIHVIPKSVTPSRITENIASFTQTNLTPAALSLVDNVRTTPPTRYCMASHYMKPGVTPLQFWGDDGGVHLP